MSQRRDSGIEAQIQQAQRRGDFDNLPGSGKPLAGSGQPLNDDWWVREKVQRERLGSDVLPTSLRLRKEIEDLSETVAKKRSEAAVRGVVEELNTRIRKAQIGPVDGPPVILESQDPDAVVAAWRAAR